MPIQSINPATGAVLKSFDALDEAALEDRLNRAVAAFAGWKKTSFEERAGLMALAADLLERDAGDIARIMALEMGKPLRDAHLEALKSARGCRYYAEHAESFLRDEEVATEAKRSYIRYEPLGPVLAIMPWNFPFWQVFRFAAPALMGGNVALLKHAPNVPQCALFIEGIFARAGFPDGVFQNFFLETERVAGVIGDPRIRAVTLTGSERAGRDVAARAGAALKKSVLELGGSDPFIVMPSANLDAAVFAAVKSRMGNAGQSCIAAKRIIVADEIANEFLLRFVNELSALKVGDPTDLATDLGPMARPDLVDALDAQVQATVAAGAFVVTGGTPVAGPGNFYPPTVLMDVPLDSPAAREELFGPVASVFRVRNIDEAIRLANDTSYGLGASVWTTDANEQARFANEIEAGQVFVNAMVVSDPRVPFGGVKNSGYGRELGIQGIHEFVNAKTVWIAG
ncbi:MAG: NAD-dependent succinate-semialdehyde dehydrogenase [Bryobacteraceae bacterium]|jgi:succinate-semialdehyde dehydrogenase/glutarate-semialdehyde dehydrogenase